MFDNNFPFLHYRTDDGNHTTTPVPTTPNKLDVDLPEKGSLENEHHYSMTIFFILLILGR
jgi:hypothetical protein